MPGIKVRIDRVQFSSKAAPGQRPPRKLEGFKCVWDHTVPSQTTINTYKRCVFYRSLNNDTKIFWRYRPSAPWLAEWTVVITPDDETGLTYAQIAKILKYCRSYRFRSVEVAVDFDPAIGIDQQFVQQHGVFGKSRRRG